MTKRSKHTLPWRVLWLIPVGLIAALSIVATGGSGGDDFHIAGGNEGYVAAMGKDSFLGNGIVKVQGKLGFFILGF